LISTLRGIEQGRLQLREQQGIPTYAAKIKKEELWIDWSKTSENIQNLIRALSPAPGARTLFRNRQLKILKSIPITDIKGKPGEIVIVEKDGFIVACGKDGLKILEVQPENSRILQAGEFVNGYRPQAGEMLG
jgi:methionyl-tRNA formyltransferase